MKKQPVFHPNAPKKLIKLWQKFPAYYRIAEHLQVNRGTVWLAMHEGREPINAETRVKFGLPRKPRKQPSDRPRTYKPDYLKILAVKISRHTPLMAGGAKVPL